MPTEAQLKREILVLKNREKAALSKLAVGKRILELQNKKKRTMLRVQKEEKALKSPKTTAFKKSLLMGAKLILKAVVLAGEDVDKKAKHLIKQHKMRQAKEQELMKVKAQAEAMKLKKAKARKSATRRKK